MDKVLPTKHYMASKLCQTSRRLHENSSNFYPYFWNAENLSNIKSERNTVSATRLTDKNEKFV